MRALYLLAAAFLGCCAAISAATLNMEAFLDQCPANDPVWANIAKDLTITRNGVAVPSVACTEPVSSLPASQNLDVIRVQQTLRLIYVMDQDTPLKLPWTPLRMYDWVKLKIGGIDISTTTGTSSCCFQLGGRPYFTYGVSTYNDVSRLYGVTFDGVISLLALVGHEVRHVDGYAHVSCCGIAGGCDQTYDETNLSAYGIQYYLYRLFLNGGINLNIQCLDPPQVTPIVNALVQTANGYPSRFCDTKPATLSAPATAGGSCMPGLIPRLNPGGVVNAGSYRAAANTPGGIVSLFGTGLSTTITAAATVPLPTSLDGVSVEFNGRAAPLFVVTPGQINAQIPYEITPSASTPVEAQVKIKGLAGFSYSFAVNSSGPGIFTYGNNLAVIQNEDYSVNAPDRPAKVGSIVTLYFTGTGRLDNPVATGAVAPSTILSRVQGTTLATIGGANAPILFIGLTPGSIGLAQANLRIPSLVSGAYSVTISINGVVSNGPSIQVAAN